MQRKLTREVKKELMTYQSSKDHGIYSTINKIAEEMDIFKDYIEDSRSYGGAYVYSVRAEVACYLERDYGEIVADYIMACYY